MKAVRCHPAALEAACELAREQNVCKLGDTVAAEGGVVAFTLEIVEGNVCTMVGARGGGDDTRRGACLQQIQEQCGQQKRRQMVQSPSQLDTVDRNLAKAVHRSRVVDQD